MSQLNKLDIAAFRQQLETYYLEHGRHELPWRIPEPDGSFDPYKIMVSELMLQQTQVPRVIPKYHAFLAQFPNMQSLATSSLGEVLKAWSGLGYNRRAKFLWQASQVIVHEFGGKFPDSLEQLIKLPGIGHNTAGAILAYAFNKPVVFIETNIRTVYIHHFFHDDQVVSDTKLRPIIEQTLDSQQPRLFYWMLMDYGAHLKKTVGNVSRRSQHHAVQSPFQGSVRQVRGAVLRVLGQQPMRRRDLVTTIPDPRLETVLTALEVEGFIVRKDEEYQLA